MNRSSDGGQAHSRLTGRKRRRGTRRPRRTGRILWWLCVELPVLVVLAVGVYFLISQLLLAPDKDAAAVVSADDDMLLLDQERAFEQWQRQGVEGYENLFRLASIGWPGYIVDVGRPARLKLAALGQTIRPFVIEKLKSREYAERITAIQLLASIGEPSEHVAQLLSREIRNAEARKYEIGALKCATTVPGRERVLIRLSLLATGSKYEGTRWLSVHYLLQLREHPAAPRDLDRRLLALLDDTSARVHLLVAGRLAKQGAPRTYRVLLAGLNSPKHETAMLAEQYVARLRGRAPVNPQKATRHQMDKAIDSHRTWLKGKLR